MRVGVTGGIAEGKSTVLGFIRDLGHETASADEIARQVFIEKEEEIAEALGLPTPLDRDQVRGALADEDKRRALNAITHPEILKQLRESEATFFEVPLLVEACLMAEFDEIWVVTCGEEEQLRRLSERLGSEEAAVKMLATQLPTRVKCAFADRIIRTNEPLESVRIGVGSLAKSK